MLVVFDRALDIQKHAASWDAWLARESSNTSHRTLHRTFHNSRHGHRRHERHNHCIVLAHLCHMVSPWHLQRAQLRGFRSASDSCVHYGFKRYCLLSNNSLKGAPDIRRICSFLGGQSHPVRALIDMSGVLRSAKDVTNFVQQCLTQKRFFQHSCAFQCAWIIVARDIEDFESGALLP